MGYSSVIVTLNPVVLVYLILNVLISYFRTLFDNKFQYNQERKMSYHSRKANYLYNRMCDYTFGKDIRLFHIQSFLSKKYKNIIDITNKFNKQIQLRYYVTSVFNLCLDILREGIIYAYLIIKVTKGYISIGDFSMYFSAITYFTTSMHVILGRLARLKSQGLYINDFREFLGISVRNDGELSLPDIDLNQSLIEFKNVSFKYPKTDKYIFRNLSVKIQGGEKLMDQVKVHLLNY